MAVDGALGSSSASAAASAAPAASGGYLRARDPLADALTVVPGSLSFVVAEAESVRTSPLARGSMVRWLDPGLIYEPFCADFGPCNLAHTWRFCCMADALSRAAAEQGCTTYLAVTPHPHRAANAAALVAIFRVLVLGEDARAACLDLEALLGHDLLGSFRDASSGPCTFVLRVRDVAAGMARARDCGLLRWGAQPGEEGAFDLDEYEHFEQVENGDLNWIVPGKILAFSGPSSTTRAPGGWRAFTPEDYVDYFKSRNVQRVVRLNRKVYDARRFTSNGIDHHELYFPDGTCPPDHILDAFLELIATMDGAAAVHCKAGLGRTGVLICSHLIRDRGFTAREAMGYLRVCRPGSVIGPQQHYLVEREPQLRAAGAQIRAFEAAMAGEKMLRADVGGRVSPGAATALAAHAHGDAMDRIEVHASATADAAAPAPAAPLSSAALAASLASTLGAAAQRPAEAARASNAATDGTAADAAPAAASEISAGCCSASGSRPPSAVASQDSQASVLNPPFGSAATSRAGSSPTTPAATPARAAAAADAMLAPRSCPSTTKRTLAPNGQPRKIPMAMSLADAAACLEDVAEEDDWTVPSERGSEDGLPSNDAARARAPADGPAAQAAVKAAATIRRESTGLPDLAAAAGRASSFVGALCAAVAGQRLAESKE